MLARFLDGKKKAKAVWICSSLTSSIGTNNLKQNSKDSKAGISFFKAVGLEDANQDEARVDPSEITVEQFLGDSLNSAVGQLFGDEDLRFVGFSQSDDVWIGGKIHVTNEKDQISDIQPIQIDDIEASRASRNRLKIHAHKFLIPIKTLKSWAIPVENNHENHLEEIGDNHHKQ